MNPNSNQTTATSPTIEEIKVKLSNQSKEKLIEIAAKFIFERNEMVFYKQAITDIYSVYEPIFAMIVGDLKDGEDAKEVAVSQEMPMLKPMMVGIVQMAGMLGIAPKAEQIFLQVFGFEKKFSEIINSMQSAYSKINITEVFAAIKTESVQKVWSEIRNENKVE